MPSRSHPKSPARGQGIPRPLSWFGRAIPIVGLGALVLAGTSMLGATVISRGADVATTGNPPEIYLGSLATRSVILDANGKEIDYLFAEQERQLTQLGDVPDTVVTSVLAIEDQRFYQHEGIDFRSGARALLADLSEGEVSQGGSTITQQLVKNELVGSEQTFERKIQEVTLALQLEDQMTKDEILERYLNVVYLGHGAYGFQAAAETYFNLDVTDLNWGEAAMLVAMIRNPVGYDPIANPELAKKRRRLVLDVLVEREHLTADEAAVYEAEPLPRKLYERNEVLPAAALSGNSYFVEEVKQQLLDMEEIGQTPGIRYDAVFRGGLQVETTFDVRAQLLSEYAVNSVPDSNGKFFAGTASIDPATGAVKAVVGGSDFETSKVNYMTQGYRQPGSTFKLIVLLEALEQGYVPQDIISGRSPCSFEDPGSEDGVYKPENYGGSRGRTTTIEKQTLSSSNCAYLRLGQVVGLKNVAALANAMGLRTPPTRAARAADPDVRASDEWFIEGDVLSLPIGSKEVHPIDLVAAYAAVANDGVYHEPYFIERVLDSDGNVLYDHSDRGVRVVSAETARLATAVLESNVKYGTGTGARLGEVPTAGKTGTSNDNADAWFVGFTPRLATGVWIGAPTGRDRVVLGGSVVTGSSYPTSVFRAMMEPYHEDLSVGAFEEPPKTRKGKTIRYKDYYVPGSRRSSSSSSSSSPSATSSTTAPPTDPAASPTTAAPGTTAAPSATTAPSPTAPPGTTAPPSPPTSAG